MITINKSIKLVNLTVNVENPRFEQVSNQREAINIMIEKQPEKIINLAKDIIESKMLNPGELIYVAPIPKEKTKFNVLEGNRRITSLKLLSNLEGFVEKDTPFWKKFKPLSDLYKKNPITEINCVIFNNPDDANKWIELRHTGENEGVGIVRWETQEKERFEEKVKGTSSLALQVLDFLKNEKSVSPDVKAKLKKVPSTNLIRIITDKNVQKAFDYSIKNKHIQTQLPAKEIAKPFSKMVLDLADKKIKVSDIYTESDRENYLLKNFSKSDIPNKDKKTASIWELTNPAITKDDGKQSPKYKVASKILPLSTDRDTLIPKRFLIKISDNKSNKIYKELRLIDVDFCENAAAVLFRVFIELSIDAFISFKKIQGVKKMSPLKEKAEKVIHFMESTMQINDHILTRIRTDINNKNSVLSIETFNAYVHNKHFTAIPKDLKTQWDDIEKLIETIWNNIK
ncbi:MAG: hypothetical protein Q8L81_17385 [Bacteroidota bacterium]|nr:hypothetical protein [Bacteroidota bacterium]